MQISICEEDKMMNRCAYYQQNALGACGEMRSSVSDGVVCPKPRRLGILNPCIKDSTPSRWFTNYQTEVCDSRAGTELLDMILTKGSYGTEKPHTQVATSPPFFCGSPPSRASNPVIQDARFGNEVAKPSPLSPAALEASPSSSARKNGGCARVKFGHKPATVRIEGFNCRGNCSISAVA